MGLGLPDWGVSKEFKVKGKMVNFKVYKGKKTPKKLRSEGYYVRKSGRRFFIRKK